jgi:hypothetical protein
VIKAAFPRRLQMGEPFRDGWKRKPEGGAGSLGRGIVRRDDVQTGGEGRIIRAAFGVVPAMSSADASQVDGLWMNIGWVWRLCAAENPYCLIDPSIHAPFRAFAPLLCRDLGR